MKDCERWKAYRPVLAVGPQAPVGPQQSKDAHRTSDTAPDHGPEEAFHILQSKQAKQ